MTPELNISGIITAEIRASLTRAGLLLFLAGFIILMGIITSEILYPLPYNTHDSYISELAFSTGSQIMVPEPSASVFNIVMIVSGLMIMIAGYYVHAVFKKYLTSIPVGIFGLGITGVGIFPGNIVPWHGIFAIVLFISGGLAAITSARVVKFPLRYIFIFFGLVALVMTFFYKHFVPYLGTGGTERWLFYPLIFWLTGFGSYILGIKDEYKTGHKPRKKPVTPEQVLS